MTKTVTEDNKLWYTPEKDLFCIGFTKDFLDKLQEQSVWHIWPASKKKVSQGAPLLSIQTEEELFSVASPLTGIYQEFSNTALNHPEKLRENSPIIFLNTAKDAVVVPSKEASAEAAFVPGAPVWPEAQRILAQQWLNAVPERLMQNVPQVDRERNEANEFEAIANNLANWDIHPVVGSRNLQRYTFGDRSWLVDINLVGPDGPIFNLDRTRLRIQAGVRLV